MNRTVKFLENIGRSARPTVERLSADSLDVRELKRCGLLQDDRMVLRGSIRWPALSRIVGSRYWLELDFAGRDTMQRVRVSWTRSLALGLRLGEVDDLRGHGTSFPCFAPAMHCVTNLVGRWFSGQTS
jgi:hypothetical protein